MQKKEILDTIRTWSDRDILNFIYEVNRTIRTNFIRLFEYNFGRMANFAEQARTDELIEKYGYDTVRHAFEEASCQPEKGKHSINYVRGILEKQNQQNHAKKEVEKGNQFKAELNEPYNLGGGWAGKESPLAEILKTAVNKMSIK